MWCHGALLAAWTGVTYDSHRLLIQGTFNGLD